jgi:hypothetical protein
MWSTQSRQPKQGRLHSPSYVRRFYHRIIPDAVPKMPLRFCGEVSTLTEALLEYHAFT